jgi:hypothetical protein
MIDLQVAVKNRGGSSLICKEGCRQGRTETGGVGGVTPPVFVKMVGKLMQDR